MKKLLPLLLIPFIYAAAPARTITYTAGDTIRSADVTENENNIFNYLQAGVDVYKDDTIVNADVNSAANIQSDKLNLTAMAQALAITSAGSFTNEGNTTLNGTTNIIGNGGSDTLTINTPSGITFTPAATWTFTANQTVSGTWADLGIATTADINGGTIDGVTIGGSSAGAGTFSSVTLSNAVTEFSTDGTFAGNSDSAVPTEKAITTYFNAHLGWNLIQSDPFTASSDASITETVSAGDLYMIVWEGLTVTSTLTPAITINGVSTGTDYGYMTTIKSTAGSGITTDEVTSGGAAHIPLFGGAGTGTDWDTGSGFIVRVYLQTRGGDTSLSFESSTGLDTDVLTSTSGVGFYNGATPTAISLKVTSGTGTLTGRFYVFKASQG